MSDAYQDTQKNDQNFSDIDNVPLTVLERMGGFWRTVSEQKRRRHEVSLKRIIIGQLVTIFVVGVSSLLIEQNQSTFLLVGATLLLYPALTDLLMSSGAVLSAGIHHDLERQDESTFRFVLLVLFRAILSTIVAGLIVGTVAGVIAVWALSLPFIDTLQLATMSTAIAALIGLPLTLIVTLIARNLQSNPDDIIPPFESSVFNVVMLLSIAVSSRLLL